MKNLFKKALATSVISLLFIQMMYIVLEPTRVIADSASDNVVVTLNVDAGISITNGSDVTMTPNIGLTSNKSVGSSSWNVKTSSSTGYSLEVKASSSPALVNSAASDSFEDYTPVGGTPDAWGGVVSGHKEFGFSGYGTDVLAAYGTATNCGNTGTGVPHADAKYQGFSTSDTQLATRNTVTTTAGITSNICFAAEQNGTYAASGAYTATITATATTI